VIADADRAARVAVENEGKVTAAAIPPRTLAVLPFAVTDADTLLKPLSFGLADLLVNDLARSPALRLVERIQTSAIMRELKLAEQGVTDPNEAPRLGRLVGARRILIGGASRAPGGAVRLSARVVDVVDGTVQELVSAEAPLERVIDAEKALALVVFERLGITLTPAQRERVDRRQTTQLAALVAYGRGVEAESRGDATGATAAFQEASRLDAAFTAARAQAAARPVPASNRAGNAARMVDLAAQAVNAPLGARIPEAIDAPLATGSLMAIIFTIRITP
jgi:TolB-like protein